MSKTKNPKRNVPEDERTEIIRKHIEDGVPLLVLATVHHLAVSTIKFWLGVEGRKHRQSRRDAASDREARLDAFTDRLARVPTQNRFVVHAYEDLDAADRERLAPAFDLYLHAHELMDQVLEVIARAQSIAAAELRDEVRAA